jgi:transposase InsO family protein
LARQLALLAAKRWQHPVTGVLVQYSTSTIERWLYRARRGTKDRVGALARRRRKDAGHGMLDHQALRDLIAVQYRDHPSWSVQLHHDNLATAAAADPLLGPCPSYQTLRRHMRSLGLMKQRRRHQSARAVDEAEGEGQREVLSYEASHVGGLWHLDFHHGKCRIVTPKGERRSPIALAMIDDRSRLCCHIQWYLTETTEDLVHGFAQAVMKRGLPAALMTDNGAAMMAGEFVQGLSRLGIVHRPTRPYSPYQNAKVESFWGTLEGRLVAMVEGVDRLELDFLNRATLAWVEQEYNRRVHSETGAAPLSRFLAGPTVMRTSPSPRALREAFRIEEGRMQRRSDGTVSVEGRRFEVPASLRHVTELTVRYARWDLGLLDVVDPVTGTVVTPLYPQDKEKNADARRRVVTSPVSQLPPRAPGVAPLLAKMMCDDEEAGLPPAFLSQIEEERT